MDLRTADRPDAAAAGVREGTALSPAGKATAKRIIDAARDLITERGNTQFSMRNVAEHAGLHLANVQYYFPRRDDLVHAFDTARNRPQSVIAIGGIIVMFAEVLKRE